MLSLSQTTGYAISALACLNDPSCRCRQIVDIARCAGVPRPYLAKIVNSLGHHHLVTAKRGYRGGITLARDPADITLLQVVEAVEGPGWLGDCLLGMDECSSQHTCPTHDFWQRIRGEIVRELSHTTLADMIEFREEKRVAGSRPARRRPKPIPRNSAPGHGLNRRTSPQPGR